MFCCPHVDIVIELKVSLIIIIEIAQKYFLFVLTHPSAELTSNFFPLRNPSNSWSSKIHLNLDKSCSVKKILLEWT